jgi:transmembrane sensor
MLKNYEVMKNANISEGLIIKYFEGKATKKDTMLLSDWLDQDKSNRQFFAVLKKIYMEVEANAVGDDTNAGKAYERFLYQIRKYEKQKTEDRKKKNASLRSVILRYAAIFLLIFSVGIASYFLGHNIIPGSDRNYCEINVPYGSRSMVILPDSSKIWLNAGSKIRYNKGFDLSCREVFLEGEAYFEIKKARHSFVVYTSHLDIRVMGTAFNVKSYPDEDNIETTLVEGNIRIDSKKSVKPVYLKPREKLTYHKPDARTEVSYVKKENEEGQSVYSDLAEAPPVSKPAREINIKRNVNTEEYTSWKDGTLIFNKESLESLARKLERKYDITFSFEDEKLKSYSYSGTLRDFPLEQVLRALELTSPVKYSINEKNVKLYFNKDFKPLKLLSK